MQEFSWYILGAVLWNNILRDDTLKNKVTIVYYGVSVKLKEKALGHLDNFQKSIYYMFEKIQISRIIR